MPLPDPGSLHCSKEITFFDNVALKPNPEVFTTASVLFSETSLRKSLQEFRIYCNHENNLESDFLSLLQYLCQVSPSQNEIVVVLGGTWRVPQFELLNEFFPNITFHLWSCTIIGNQTTETIRKKYGFPSALSYSGETIHLFSNIQSENSMLAIQTKLIKDLKPKTSSLYFQPPHSYYKASSCIEYFDGEMHPICYGKPFCTAVRLLLKDYTLKQYNLLAYEEMLNYYNTELRSTNRWLYKEVLRSFDDCYRNSILWGLLGPGAHYKQVRQLWHRILFVCRNSTPKL